MTRAVVMPGPVAGRVHAPPSKSYTHRALVVAHLARRQFVVERPLRSDDTLRTVAAVRALGSRVEMRPSRWTVRRSVSPGSPRGRIDCGESGTTLRFAAALAALRPWSTRLVGRGRLPQRPMSPLVHALRTLGATVELPDGPRSLPMRVRGPLRGGPVTVDASESSQFVSALLLALPTADGNSIVRLRSAPVSGPYIQATVAILRACGIRLTEAPRQYRMAGRQRYRGDRFRVPPDASSAAYLWAAAAVAGGSVTVAGLPDPWPQADLAILDLLVRYGAIVERRHGGTTVRGGERRAFSVRLDDAPDLYPLAGVLAATARGTSRLRGAAHVAGKESDRRATTIALTRSFGATVRARSGVVTVSGARAPRAVHLTGITDHRVAMSAAVGALTASGPSSIEDASVVRKSYPEFWSTLARLSRGGRSA